jgi:hypothetical protein
MALREMENERGKREVNFHHQLGFSGMKGGCDIPAIKNQAENSIEPPSSRTLHPNSSTFKQTIQKKKYF